MAGARLVGAGDLIGVNPLLGPLRDNGGSTETRALKKGSPAISHGASRPAPAAPPAPAPTSPASSGPKAPAATSAPTSAVNRSQSVASDPGQWGGRTEPSGSPVRARRRGTCRFRIRACAARPRVVTIVRSTGSAALRDLREPVPRRDRAGQRSLPVPSRPDRLAAALDGGGQATTRRPRWRRRCGS
jgi:hypothetical protein